MMVKLKELLNCVGDVLKEGSIRKKWVIWKFDDNNNNKGNKKRK